MRTIWTRSWRCTPAVCSVTRRSAISRPAIRCWAGNCSRGGRCRIHDGKPRGEVLRTPWDIPREFGVPHPWSFSTRNDRMTPFSRTLRQPSTSFSCPRRSTPRNPPSPNTPSRSPTKKPSSSTSTAPAPIDPAKRINFISRRQLLRQHQHHSQRDAALEPFPDVSDQRPTTVANPAQGGRFEFQEPTVESEEAGGQAAARIHVGVGSSTMCSTQTIEAAPTQERKSRRKTAHEQRAHHLPLSKTSPCKRKPSTPPRLHGLRLSSTTTAASSPPQPFPTRSSTAFACQARRCRRTSRCCNAPT